MILIDHKLNQRYKDVMPAGISQRAKATIPGVFRDKIISADVCPAHNPKTSPKSSPKERTLRKKEPHLLGEVGVRFNFRAKSHLPF